MIINLRTFQEYFAIHLDHVKQALSTYQLTLKKSYKSPPTPFAFSHYLLLGDNKIENIISENDLLLVEKLPDGTTVCQSWITPHGLITALPTPVINLKGEESDQQFNQIIQLLKKFRSKKSRKICDGIIFYFDIQNFLSLPHFNQEKIVELITQPRLKSLVGKSAALTCHLLFSHCEAVSGFQNFFNTLSSQQRQQPCGLAFTEALNRDNFKDNWAGHFKNFLNLLHTHAFHQLPHAKRAVQQQLIYNFPLQIESLENIFKELIFYLLDANPALYIHSLLLTSIKQESATIDRLAKPLNQAFALSQASLGKAKKRSFHYFNREIIKTISHTDNLTQLNRKKASKPYFISPWTRRTILGSTLAIVLVGLYGLIHNFTQQVRQLHKAEYALNRLEITLSEEKSNPNINMKLDPLLDYLGQAESNLQALTTRKLWPQWLPHVDKLSKQLQRLDREIIVAHLLPELSRYILQQLQNLPSNQTEKIYAHLKAYLMLTKPVHFDVKYLTTYLKAEHTITPTLANKNFALLLSHLPQLALHAPLILHLDDNIVSAKRQELLKLPLPVLTYIVLKNTLEYSDKNYPQLETYNSSDQDKNDIPYLYTRRAISNIYPKLFDTISQQMQKGDWVISEAPPTTVYDLESLKRGVSDLYFSEYRNWWNLYLYNHKPNYLVNDNTQDKVPTVSTNKNFDDFEKILKTVKAHTQPLENYLPIAKTFNDQVAQHFAGLNNLSVDQIQRLQIDLREFSQFMQHITQGPNQELALFEVVKQKFNNPGYLNPLFKIQETAGRYPEPLQTWLSNLTTATWLSFLAHTQSLINTEWQNQVYKFYQDKIANHYPLAKDADTEVSLQDFITFFSYEGQLNQFLQEYLMPFLNTASPKWSIKNVGGYSLPINMEMVAQFQRARIIRHMFFRGPNNELMVQFNIAPKIFEPIVKDLELSISGVAFTAGQDEAKEQSFVWPSNNDNLGVTLALTQVDGHRSEIHFNGVWSWLRLIDSANLKATTDTKHFEILFNLEGNSVRAELTSPDLINPFIPSIMETFNLPQQILKPVETAALDGREEIVNHATNQS